MVSIAPLIEQFMRSLGTGGVEVYNEFSLQFELAYHLRSELKASPLRVDFERPVSHFSLERPGFIKKEIDLTIHSAAPAERHAVELKYPRNGQVPEQMFKACQDIRFLEQLRAAGFAECHFLLVTDDQLFWGGAQNGIYRYFRGVDPEPIRGCIQKPTGQVDSIPPVELQGEYRVRWQTLADGRRYCHVIV